MDTPQVNVFQLPDRVLETVAPDALVFKYATEEERNQMLDEMKGFNQADQQVESDSAEIERSVTPAAPMVNVQDPTKVPDAPQVAEAPATALGNLGNNYSFLFPQDPTGQAIAKKDTQSG